MPCRLFAYFNFDGGSFRVTFVIYNWSYEDNQLFYYLCYHHLVSNIVDIVAFKFVLFRVDTSIGYSSDTALNGASSLCTESIPCNLLIHFKGVSHWDERAVFLEINSSSSYTANCPVQPLAITVIER